VLYREVPRHTFSHLLKKTAGLGLARRYYLEVEIEQTALLGARRLLQTALKHDLPDPVDFARTSCDTQPDALTTFSIDTI